MSVSIRELPVRPPQAFDNSMLSTHQRCPRKAFYQYYLDRAPDGENFPIQFGLAYHRFREVLEKIYLQKVVGGDLELDRATAEEWMLISAAKAKDHVDWSDPSPEHKKAYLNEQRLDETFEEALDVWMMEKRQGRVEVLFTEQPFAVPFPDLDEQYTGRMDQIVEWNGKLWVRDFKTTSRMGRNYSDQFDPNNQMTGYVWAAQLLSGRKVEGVMIEVVYNTKTKGPEFHPFLSTRTPNQVEEWVEEQQYEVRAARQHEEDAMFPKRTVACNDYGGCFFREACQKDNWWTREKWLRSHTIESRWDPLNPQEEEGVVD